ncbi:MAG: riboflavin synthase [Verrucomicrobia bacterium]|nr:MAG: riboflavin synthase [Verrucomicrobiota bacterium]
MFTGIITHLGTVLRPTSTGLEIGTPREFLVRVTKGESIAVNGTCLTVVRRRPTAFTVAVIPETFRRTQLGSLRAGSRVNLERPMTAQSFLSGHLVQGHVDGTARLRRITRQGNSRVLAFVLPAPLARYIVEKGSIAVNGVSLTVMTATRSGFTVGIIPHTWEHTTLQALQVGDRVNIETDLVAKYVAKLFRKTAS